MGAQNSLVTIGIRRCTQDDFGQTDDAITMFNSISSKYLVCPDFQ